jgi:enoyl-CoA hydratase/carnithine racemase
VNVIVLTGGEKYFSAGFDLNEIRKLQKESNEAYTALFHRAYRAILFCELPVIAAVGGPAIAGGFDLTMMCDIRYASERAKFGQREIALSLTPIMDPLWRIIGLGRAKEVALTGRIYGADEAERMGYVSRVFPEGQLLVSVAACGHRKGDGRLRSHVLGGDQAAVESDPASGPRQRHAHAGVAVPHLHRFGGQSPAHRSASGPPRCRKEKVKRADWYPILTQSLNSPVSHA